ncbi:MAG: hypothetical protein GDYSWBUE_001945 [Candidatus Fervidibacterota bacterium]
MFLKVIACEIARREICFVVAKSRNIVDLEFLPVGYHDEPQVGRGILQAHVDLVPKGQYDAILIGYGLCNTMLVGLTARDTRLVIPRAHDCITFFLGSKERYQQVFSANPGTYFYTAGWLELPKCKRRESDRHGLGRDELPSQNVPIAFGKSFAELVEQYGEENALYILEVAHGWTQKYKCGMLISFDFTEHLGLREEVREICRQRGWEYRELKGDLGLLERWVDGQWDEAEFLIVQPGETVYATYDEQIIAASKTIPNHRGV